MAKRKLTQSEHDVVVRASAATYSDLEKQGNKVTTNPNGQQNQKVGEDNYPDVIVWKPSEENPNSGTAIVIEEIETEESVTESESIQWKKYAELGVSVFRLIVPLSKTQDAYTLIVTKKIKVSEIWSYEIKDDGRVTFQKHFSF